MPVEFRTGDLFAQADIHAIAHGCNAAGAMGKGIAVHFKERWPAMYSEYRARCADGRFNPGDVFVWEDAGVTVFNLGTEKHWRTGATLEAIERSLTEMVSARPSAGTSPPSRCPASARATAASRGTSSVRSSSASPRAPP